MKVYHNSQAYQSWIAAKGKVDVDAEQEEPEKARRSVSLSYLTLFQVVFLLCKIMQIKY